MSIPPSLPGSVTPPLSETVTQLMPGVVISRNAPRVSSPLAATQQSLPRWANSKRRSTLQGIFDDLPYEEEEDDDDGYVLSGEEANNLKPAMSPVTLDYDERGWFSFMTSLCARKGTVFPYVLPQILLNLVFTAGVVVWYKHNPSIGVEPEGHIIVGSLVALLLVFRSNISFQRYSEARGLLGTIKGGIRTVATLSHAVPCEGFGADSSAELKGIKAQLKGVIRQLQVLFAAMIVDVRDSREEREDFSVGPAAMPNAPALRETVQVALQRIIVDSRRRHDAWLYRRYSPAVRPAIVAQGLVRMLVKLSECDILPSAYSMEAVKVVNTEIMGGWDGLVRIVTTPAPFPYRHLLGVIVFAFCFSLPFGLVEGFGWLTLPTCGLVTAAYYGILRLALELQNPLGWDLNDIDLEGFSSVVAEEAFAVHASTFGVPETTPAATTTMANPNGRKALTFVSAVQAALHLDSTRKAHTHGQRASAVSMRSATSRVTFGGMPLPPAAAAAPRVPSRVDFQPVVEAAEEHRADSTPITWVSDVSDDGMC